MKRVVIANFKGGVAKSTTALFLAENWARVHSKRVLVIDLDPQANASLMLLSRRGLLALADGVRTLPRLLSDAQLGNIQASITYIEPRVGDLTELMGNSPGFISILPSIPRLSMDEYELDSWCLARGHNPVTWRREVMSAFLQGAENNFDCVIMDCQPGFGPMTRAACMLADTVIAPTIADAISVRSLGEFVRLGLEDRLQIRRFRLRVVVSKYTNSVEQRRELDGLRREYDGQLISPPVPFSVQAARVAERIEGRWRTYNEKYAPRLRSLALPVEKMATAIANVVFVP